MADLLWQAEPDPDGWQSVALPRPPALSHSDLLQWAALMCGAMDPLRSDLRPEAVVRNARRLIATSVEVLRQAAKQSRRGKSTRRTRSSGSIAHRLTHALAGTSDARLVSAFDTALVILADHELATSTVAVRVAASTRADIYNVLGAGLCTLAGPLHGGASELAHDVLVQAERLGVAHAVDSTLRWQKTLPGFGHTVYKAGDPRFNVLMSKVEDLATKDQRQLLRSLQDLAVANAMPGCNIDLALAALSWVNGLPT